MRFAAPKKYHASLVPKHGLYMLYYVLVCIIKSSSEMGCKRVLFDSNYLASFHRPNVSLYLGGVKEVVEDGLITTNGKFAKQK